MIEIKKINEQEIIKRICDRYSLEWKKEYHVIATIENGEVLHCAVFEYQNGVGFIHAIAGFDDDIEMLDGLCRAILNIMDINGVELVKMPLKYQKLAEKIGFSIEDDAYSIKLDGFFKCCCHQQN